MSALGAAETASGLAPDANGRHAPAGRSGREGGHVQEMQRRRMLLAMVEVLAEHGLQDATIARVCKRAGVSRRTFYELFDDREACLLAAFELALEQAAKVLAPAFAGSDRWRVRVRRALNVLLELFDAQPQLARLCVVETLKAGPRVARRRAQALAVLVDAIEQGRSESERGSEPPPLAGEAVVGGALAIVHARLLAAGRDDPPPLRELTGPLTSMIVQPYLGASAARRELQRRAPANSAAAGVPSAGPKDPFRDLPIRLTYRTARVLATIAAEPGASNRLIGDSAGIADDGQTSRLLSRLRRTGLIENRGEGRYTKGEPNAWALTRRGQAIYSALSGG